jgi:hypothetical protein
MRICGTGWRGIWRRLRRRDGEGRGVSHLAVLLLDARISPSSDAASSATASVAPWRGHRCSPDTCTTTSARVRLKFLPQPAADRSFKAGPMYAIDGDFECDSAFDGDKDTTTRRRPLYRLHRRRRRGARTTFRNQTRTTRRSWLPPTPNEARERSSTSWSRRVDDVKGASAHSPGQNLGNRRRDRIASSSPSRRARRNRRPAGSNCRPMRWAVTRAVRPGESIELVSAAKSDRTRGVPRPTARSSSRREGTIRSRLPNQDARPHALTS